MYINILCYTHIGTTPIGGRKSCYEYDFYRKRKSSLYTQPAGRQVRETCIIDDTVAWENI